MIYFIKIVFNLKNIMLRINGIGDSLDGYVHPDSEVKEMYCENCKENTPFIKMIGAKRNYFFWIPLPTKEKEKIYWQCNYCQQFVYYENPEVK